MSCLLGSPCQLWVCGSRNNWPCIHSVLWCLLLVKSAWNVDCAGSRQEPRGASTWILFTGAAVRSASSYPALLSALDAPWIYGNLCISGTTNMHNPSTQAEYEKALTQLQMFEKALAQRNDSLSSLKKLLSEVGSSMELTRALEQMYKAGGPMQPGLIYQTGVHSSSQSCWCPAPLCHVQQIVEMICSEFRPKPLWTPTHHTSCQQSLW